MEVEGDDTMEHTTSNLDDVITLAPSLYSRHTSFRNTRKPGKIIRDVKERYLRDDLGFGSYFVDEDDDRKAMRRVQEAAVGKPKVIESMEHLESILIPCQTQALVVCDTNVLLHNLDVLEQSAAVMPNLVFPHTCLLECKANRLVAYDRVVELLRTVGDDRCCIFFSDIHHSQTSHVEGTNNDGNNNNMSINDENDARIRNVADYFGRHLQGSSDFKVVLLTDDKGSRALRPADAPYQAYTVRGWVQELEAKNPGLSLMDLVAQYGTNAASGSNSSQQEYFPAHEPASALSTGIQTGAFYRGVLRSRDLSSAWVTVRRGEERIAVTIQDSMDRNRAVDGDVVAIQLHSLDQWLSDGEESKENATATKPTSTTAGIASDTAEPSLSDIHNVPDSIQVQEAAVSGTLRPTGKVVGIIKRNFDNISGSIYQQPKNKATATSERDRIASEHEREHSDGTHTCVFFPVDAKVPPILIRTAQRSKFLGQRIVVSMDSWPSNSPYPLGHYVSTIGKSGSKDVETEIILQEHKIAHEPFSAAVLACLPPNDYQIEMAEGRTDLRKLPVLSIDPPGCKDIDDALHCIVLPNGNFQVGVHIADVTHYVKSGSAMDMEAANRSTSTYLVNKRLDMLPALLTTDLCSLKGNVDRYAFSVLWEVTPEADIVNVDFKKSIIHSIAALTYQEAQSFIDQPDAGDDPRANAVKGLAALARKFRQRRLDAGALTLASPEVKFVLDSESLNPTDVQAYALLEANALVEEFMLLANVTVSKKILRHYPTLSVLRRHPSPNRSMFESLITKARCRGIAIDIEDSKRLADSLDQAVVPGEPYVNKLLRILSTRCMSPAQYFCSGEYRPSDWHHYGLAAPVYTHFTSPIRRYADVCVHRLLAAAIGVAPLPVRLSSKSYLHDLCANMNRRHRAAQLAGRASVQLHTLLFFANDTKEEDAYVLDLETSDKSEPWMTVMVPRYGIEGKLQITDRDDPLLQRHPNEHKWTYSQDGDGDGPVVHIQVFDKVRVRISVRTSEDQQRELIMELVEPVIKGMSTASSLETEVATTKRSNEDTTSSTKASSSSLSPSKRPKKRSKK
eukprot:Nitzschia sp. Nitz4//scaffold326_size20077//3326//6553//NITZ4_008710-RA/size20077-processed-gene-0.45-mRNA-1//-1//CDS//3329547924//339//frame0